MPGVDDIVHVVLLTESSSVAREGFGTPLVLGGASATAILTAGGRTDMVGSFTSESDLLTDGLCKPTDPEYLAMAAFFAQNPKPSMVKLGRRANPPTQSYSVTPLAYNSVAYNLVIDGKTATYTSDSSATVAEIVAGLKAAIDALYTLPTAWVRNTPYVVGDIRSKNHRAFQCITAGTSEDSGSPVFDGTSTGADQTDGTCHWKYLAGDIAVPWYASMAHVAGDQVTNGGRVYQCITAGASAGAGGPTGRLQDITDGAAHWKFMGVVPTTTNQSSTYLTVAAAVANEYIRLAPSNALAMNRMRIIQTNVDGGIATDLAAIKLEDNNWYALQLTMPGVVEALLAAAWVESNQKLMVVQSQDVGICSSAADDIATTLYGSAYARTACIFHPDPGVFADAAWMGRCLPLDPGSETWAFKTLASIPAVQLTPAQQNFATGTLDQQYTDGKRCNIYIPLGGVNVTVWGLVADREFIDKIRGCDWYKSDMQANVYGRIAGSPTKIPYTDDGAQVIGAAMRKTNDKAVARGFLAASPKPYVTIPLVADEDPDVRQSRILADVKAGGTIAGAIHATKITVTLGY